MQDLVQAYNLSQELRKLCKNLTVQIICQKFASALPEEQAALNIQEHNSFIREVYLQGDGINLVHARVIVPNATYRKYQTEFDNLGSNFLGEHFLYKHKHTRSQFIYQQNARSSIFDLGSYKLMVIEKFLETVAARSV